MQIADNVCSVRNLVPPYITRAYACLSQVLDATAAIAAEI
jgi:hypothetical protein